MIAARAVLSIPPTILLAWLLHVAVEVPAQLGRPRIGWLRIGQRAPDMPDSQPASRDQVA
jgi:peptidoglycan/LPS O-acetylase OafA/YrhL